MAMTVTTDTLPTPRPRVVIEIDGAPPEATNLSILRTAQGFTQPVIQARGALVGGGALVTDWAAAVGRNLQYTVTALDGAGSILEQVSAPAGPLPDTPVSYVWLSDPLDENSAMLVEAVGDTGQQVGRPATIALAQPLLAPYPTASTSQRRGIDQYQVVIEAHGPAEQAAINALLDAPCLCVRIGTTGLMPAVVPPVLYGVAERPTMTADTNNDIVEYAIELAPTNGPGISAINSAWSWDDVAATGLPWLGEPSVQSLFGSWWELAKGDL